VSSPADTFRIVVENERTGGIARMFEGISAANVERVLGFIDSTGQHVRAVQNVKQALDDLANIFSGPPRPKPRLVRGRR
jgi:hypothetical protein